MVGRAPSTCMHARQPRQASAVGGSAVRPVRS
jgi:hypothetical protein